ncbi:hypothetical protein [Streptomyces sp. NPDC017529]|uniref:hypothetical protein n=1 Tax=Streptomyces sp. NPDC017529 TaxID=3365000 RepID=UPI0037997C4E
MTMRNGARVISVLVVMVAAVFGSRSVIPAAATDPLALKQENPEELYFVAYENSARYEAGGTPYQTVLYPGDSSKVERPRGVVAEYDLSEVAGKVKVTALHPRCRKAGHIVTCRLGDDEGAWRFRPFRMTPYPDAQGGMAGSVSERYTSRNGPGLTHSARIHIGVPEFRTRVHQDVELPRSERGAPPPITPAFVNAGSTRTPGKVVLRISVADDGHKGRFQSPRFAPSFSNCSYPESETGTEVIFCEFPGPLEAGQAYETDAPLQARNPDCCQVRGAYTYDVWAEGNEPLDATVQGSHPLRGSGPVLGLKPVGADTVTGGTKARMGFRTEGFTVPEGWSFPEKTMKIRGKVGEYVETDVLQADSADGVLQRASLRVRLPEGTSMAPLPLERHASDFSYCSGRGREGTCANGYPSILRVRIDRPVPGAEGRIKAPVPSGDENPDDNERPVELEITGVAASPQHDPPDWVARYDDPARKPGAGESKAADKAAHGVPVRLASAATAAVVVAGLAVLAVRRRRRRQRSNDDG